MEKTYLGDRLDQCAVVPCAVFKHMYYMEILKLSFYTTCIHSPYE